MVKGQPDFFKGIVIEGITISQIPINIVAQTLGTVKIDISAQSLGTVNVNIASSGITLQVNIASQTANLNVNLAASAITLNVAIQSSAVTLNVSVTSSVAINIKTSGGVNIVIDQLTQSAYRARVSTLTNDNGVSSPTAPPYSLQGVANEGKFFPRGCRGVLSVPYIYCLGDGVQQIVLAFSPAPGMGKVASVTITPGASWDWKSGNYFKMWNYDSLFIWVESCGANCYYGYDTSTPYDAFYTADGGVTWPYRARRYFIRLEYYGLTVGDLPVSGTINTVEIPSIAAHALWASQTSIWGQETTITNINGAGKTLYIELHVAAAADSQLEALRVYSDGSLAFSHQFAMLNAYGYGASTPGISLTKYAAAGECVMLVTLPIPFRRLLSLRVYNYGAVNHVDDLRMSYSLIK